MTVEDQSMETLCIPPRPGHVVFPMKRNFTAHTAICRKMKGVASVIRDEETRLQMDLDLNFPEQCSDDIRRLMEY